MVASVELLHKLQIHGGLRMWMINVPQEIVDALTAGSGIEPVKEDDPYDGALVFCQTPAEVEALVPRILAKLPPDGMLWFAYRKGTAAKESGLSRDAGWEPLAQAGYRPVRSVALDEEWTGLRFREAKLVNAKEGSRFA